MDFEQTPLGQLLAVVQKHGTPIRGMVGPIEFVPTREDGLLVMVVGEEKSRVYLLAGRPEAVLTVNGERVGGKGLIGELWSKTKGKWTVTAYPMNNGQVVASTRADFVFE